MAELKNSTVIVYSNLQIDESVFTQHERLRYIAPKFFKDGVKRCDFVYTSVETIATAYAKEGIPQHPKSPMYGVVEIKEPEVEKVSDDEYDKLMEEINTSESEFDLFNDPKPEPEPEKEDVKDEPVAEEKTPNYADMENDEIESLPFFTMKKALKEKYGVAPKNKEEAKQIIADNS